MCNIIEIVQIIATSSGFWAVLGALIGSYGTYYYNKKFSIAEKLAQTYANLHGIRRYLKQLYVSRFEAYVYSDAHEALWRISGFSSNLDCEEAKRWMHKSEELAIEIARVEERLAKYCGLILALCPKKAMLVTTVKKLLKHGNIERSSIDLDWDAQKVENEKIKMIKSIQKQTDEIFDPLFEEILNNKQFDL